MPWWTIRKSTAAACGGGKDLGAGVDGRADLADRSARLVLRSVAGAFEVGDVLAGSVSRSQKRATWRGGDGVFTVSRSGWAARRVG
jgi:hypothetical protein